jgi:cytidine deaminase
MKISSKHLDDIISFAVKTMQNSYSPYSHYKVGAAAIGESGAVYTGTNVENASYGLTICAERAAIFNAVSHGERRIQAMVLVSQPQNLDQINSPCGACRQVMAEFGPADMPIYIADIIDGKVARVTRKKLKDFLPYAFTPSSFKAEPKKKKK